MTDTTTGNTSSSYSHTGSNYGHATETVDPAYETDVDRSSAQAFTPAHHNIMKDNTGTTGTDTMGSTTPGRTATTAGDTTTTTAGPHSSDLANKLDPVRHTLRLFSLP